MSSASAERRRWVAALGTAAAFCAAAVLAAGCGGYDSPAREAPAAASFPAVEGRSLLDLYGQTERSGLVVLPVGLVYEKGTRYGFAVYTVAKKQVTEADIAIYFSHGEDGPALGPYPARVESLQTRPQFQSQSTGEDPESSKALYVVDRPPFDRDGEWRALAVVDEGDGSFRSVFTPSIVVGHFPRASQGFPRSPANPPAVGERAPRVHTPTEDDVADITEIDTRIPPDQMHEDDLADVLGRKPVIIVFATPAFCQSRACGPVVDVAEEARARYGEGVSFIHMEIYNGNDPTAGVRPQVKAFRLPSEPWLFAIDADGVIRTRIEGAWSVADVEAAAAGLLKEKGA